MPRGIEVKKFPFLSQIERWLIHEGSCRVLEEVGIGTSHEGAARLFTKEGAKVKNGRITIPKELVERSVEQTAKRMVLGAGNPENEILIDTENPRVYYGTGGQALYVLRHQDDTFKKKPAVTQDLIDIVRICERLDNVDFITRPVEPDVPEEEMDLEKTRIFLENTTKHINLANLILADKLPDILDMVQDKSLISFISCVPVSPLNWADSTAEKFMRIVEKDIPVALSSCPQAGTTAPLSEVGELVQVNAEILSAVVLANLVRPGAKILYRGIPITSNLHVDASPRWCQPDSIRRIALVSNVADYYGIPCCGTAAVSDEKEPNPQSLSEKALSWVFETVSGAQFINSALGMLEQVMTVSPEQYIIDDMVLSRIKELFSDSADIDLKETAHMAVKDGLSMFGVHMDSGMKEDISRRIEFILSRREPYTEDYIEEQVHSIREAVNSGKSSSRYMKTSRKGLRKGWLFSGSRIEGALRLEEVCRIRDDILLTGILNSMRNGKNDNFWRQGE